jgi:hypothetical protein
VRRVARKHRRAVGRLATAADPARCAAERRRALADRETAMRREFDLARWVETAPDVAQVHAAIWAREAAEARVAEWSR